MTGMTKVSPLFFSKISISYYYEINNLNEVNMPVLIDTVIQRVADALCASLHLFPDEDGNTGEQDEHGYEIYKAGTSLYINDTVPNSFVEEMEKVLKMKVTDLVLTKDTNKAFFVDGCLGFITEDFYKAVDDLIRNRIYEFNTFFSESSAAMEMSMPDFSLVSEYLKRTLSIVNIAEISEAKGRLENSYRAIMRISTLLGIDDDGHSGRGLLGAVKNMRDMATLKLSNPEVAVFSSFKGYDSVEDEKQFFEDAKKMEYRVQELEETIRMILTGEFDEQRVRISSSTTSFMDAERTAARIRREFSGMLSSSFSSFNRDLTDA
jgi:hypothetical protein